MIEHIPAVYGHLSWVYHFCQQDCPQVHVWWRFLRSYVPLIHETCPHDLLYDKVSNRDICNSWKQWVFISSWDKLVMFKKIVTTFYFERSESKRVFEIKFRAAIFLSNWGITTVTVHHCASITIFLLHNVAFFREFCVTY